MKFAGLPVAHWLFGLRTWVSMMSALYAAFWLQLDGASSAAVCVSILALPTRGQVLDKARYRLLGTIVGVAASFVIAGLFNEVRTLFVLAAATWLALCVYAACMLDGFRAYAAVLSGYTVAIVAVSDIDRPQSVFSSGINRGAAIAVGIAVTALVNEFLRAPSLLPKLLQGVRSAHAEVRAFAKHTIEDGGADAETVVRLLGRITALRNDAMPIAFETVSGRHRRAAARRALAELVGEVQAIRVVAEALPDGGDRDRRARLAGRALLAVGAPPLRPREPPWRGRAPG